MGYSKKIRNKLYQYFSNQLGMFDYSRGWLKGDCPECGKHNKFGIHLGHNRSNCFVCGFNMKPLPLVGYIEGLKTQNDILNYLGGFEGMEYTEPPGIVLEEKKAKLPKTFRLISLGRSFISKTARRQLESRGFDISTLTLQGVGYCTGGEYANRIIFPFYENGELVYFHARTILANASKFKNPNTEEFGIGKSLLIYNVDALKIHNRIYLVESVTNALTLGEKAIAIGGKILSNYQLMKILLGVCKEVVIILDRDAWSYAVNTALTMIPYKKVKLIKMPKDKDVNDLGRKATLKLVKQSKFETYQHLLLEQKNLEISWAE